MARLDQIRGSGYYLVLIRLNPRTIATTRKGIPIHRKVSFPPVMPTAIKLIPMIRKADDVGIGRFGVWFAMLFLQYFPDFPGSDLDGFSRIAPHGTWT